MGLCKGMAEREVATSDEKIGAETGKFVELVIYQRDNLMNVEL